MNVEAFRDYCLSKKFVTEHFPFDEVTLVFKVADKSFAFTGLDHVPFRVNLKCDPERAISLREEYDGAIVPGWHMNKHHWNTVYFEENLPTELLIDLIDHSYDMVVKGFTKKKQRELGFL